MICLAFFRFLQTRALRLFSHSPSNRSHSPIAGVPNEILLIIFDLCISNALSEHAPPFLTPILLSHISRRWRTLITSSPSFWTHVPIAPSQSNRTLQLFLQNSSPLPIEVTVHPWPVAYSPLSIVSLDTQLHTLLNSECDRERIVSLMIDSTGLDDQVDRVIRTWLNSCHGRVIPLLKSVYLKGASHTVWTGSWFFDRDVAPSLTVLVIEDMPLVWFQAPSTRTVSSPDLTTLIWKHASGSDRVSILEFSQFVSSFPRLESIELHGPVVDFEGPGHFESKYSAPMSVVSSTGSVTFENVCAIRIVDEVHSQFSLDVLYRLFPSLSHGVNAAF